MHENYVGPGNSKGSIAWSQNWGYCKEVDLSIEEFEPEDFELYLMRVSKAESGKQANRGPISNQPAAPQHNTHSPLRGYTLSDWMMEDDGSAWKHWYFNLHKQRLEHWFFIEPSTRNSARSAEAAMVHLQSLVGCVGNATIGGWDSCRVGTSVLWTSWDPILSENPMDQLKDVYTNSIEFPWQQKVFGKFNPNNTSSW